MNDLISRQAAIDETWKYPSYSDPLNVLTEVRDNIKALPSVDAVEVVRCKDCKYWNELLCQCDRRKPPLLLFGAKDFCSRAERRTDESD